MTTTTPTPSHVLNVLIACEESQAECAAFRALGHNAYSCDLERCRPSANPHWHIVGDATPLLMGCSRFVTQAGDYTYISHWDLIIAHPPCTYLSKVGSPWMRKDIDGVVLQDGQFIAVNYPRYVELCRARAFFLLCLNARAAHVAVENPIPMRIAQLPAPDFYVDPSWFGVKYTKKTLYWVRDLPPIMAGVSHPNPKCYTMHSRGKYRARTFPALAQAIAAQWSEYILNKDYK